MTNVACPVCKIPQEALIGLEGNMICPQHADRVLLPMVDLQEGDTYQGLILEGKYELLKPLGHGGFGSVYLATQRGQIRQQVAVKLLTRHSAEYVDLFRDEMRVIAQLRSPFTVRYLDSGVHQSQSAIGPVSSIPYMVMEYLNGDTLAHRLIYHGVVKLEEMLTFTEHLLSSLMEAHQLGIIHRDLKPLNLMLTPSIGLGETLKVLDFGIARMMEQESREATRNRIMGTPYYIAPEVLLKHELSPLSDLFSTAVILYESVTCHSPFLNEELTGIEPYLKLRSIYKEGRPHDPLPVELPSELTIFFNRALAIDPTQRFQSAHEMLLAVQQLKEVIKRGPILTPPPPPQHFEEDFEVTTVFRRRFPNVQPSAGSSIKKLNPPALPAAAIASKIEDDDEDRTKIADDHSQMNRSVEWGNQQANLATAPQVPQGATVVKAPPTLRDPMPPRADLFEQSQPLPDVRRLPTEPQKAVDQIGHKRLHVETSDLSESALEADSEVNSSSLLSRLITFTLFIALIGYVFKLAQELFITEAPALCKLSYDPHLLKKDLNFLPLFDVSEQSVMRDCPINPECQRGNIQCEVEEFKSSKIVTFTDLDRCLDAGKCSNNAQVQPCDEGEEFACVPAEYASSFCNDLGLKLPSYTAWLAQERGERDQRGTDQLPFEWVQYTPDVYMKIRWLPKIANYEQQTYTYEQLREVDGATASIRCIWPSSDE